MASPTLAAGGIVVRHESAPRFAVVRLRKDKAWVLPKGKLNRNETARDAARREVMEETGHQVSVHEFVGALAYSGGGKSKIVQFWRMQASGVPKRKLMRDVSAVEFLPLRQAVERLTRPYERVFLETVGPAVLRSMASQERKRVAQKTARVAATKKRARKAAMKKAKRRAVATASVKPLIDMNGDDDMATDRRPWLQRYVIDRLLTPETVRRSS